MGGFGAGTSNTEGSTAPITTGLWNTTTGAAGGLLNGSGLTGGQQYATDRMLGVVANQPMGYALQGVNATLADLIKRPAPTITAPGAIEGPTAAAMSDPYTQLYAQELINPALGAYDYGSDRAFSALDARTAGSGAFANSRSGLAYSDLGAQRALGRGQLEAQLKGQGLQAAIGAGADDANRALNAREFSAAQDLQARLANQGSELGMVDKRLAALSQQAGNDVNTNTMGLANTNALYNMSGGGLTNLLSLAGSQVPAFGAITQGRTGGSQSGTSSSSQTGTSAGSSSGSSTGYNSGSQAGLHFGK